MKWIARLLLFAIGTISNASFAFPICYTNDVNGWLINLSDNIISSAECKTLFTDRIDSDMSILSANGTTCALQNSSDNEYICLRDFDKFPCGTFRNRYYSCTQSDGSWIDRNYNGYWQGIPRNYTLWVTNSYSNGAPRPPESSTVLTSVEPSTPLSTPSVWLAITSIDDNTGLVSGGATVRVTTDVLMNSGGHQHDNNRNTEQAGSLNSSGKTISLGTDGGIVNFTFAPPEASGDHTITATCDPGANGLSTCSMGSGNVWVGVKDLQPLIPYSQYNLIGEITIHPDNHYVTSDTASKIMELAYYYHSVSFPLDPVLQLNDASLQRGGVFDIYYAPYTQQGVSYSRDINGWYSPPHKEHRRGTVIDIQANGSDTAIPRANQGDFEIMMTKRGMSFLKENLNRSGGHYHVKVQGVAE